MYRSFWVTLYLAAIKDVLRMFLPSTQLVGSDQEARLKYVERMNINSKILLLEKTVKKKKPEKLLKLSAYMSIVALPAPMAAVSRYLCGVKA